MSKKMIAYPDLSIFPERRAQLETTLDLYAAKLKGHIQRLCDQFSFELSRKKFLKLVNKNETPLRHLSDDELVKIACDLRLNFKSREVLSLKQLAQVFALIREVADRTVKMRPYDVQILAGFEMMQQKVAEIRTGEGKTLIASLPAATVALTGFPVHVVTVNDYLAERDAQLMTPIYHFLGLRVGVVKEGMSEIDRRSAYDCDVTYCTNKELAFDYLRDRMILGNASTELNLKLERFLDIDKRSRKTVMRGLYFAVLDEADSVLVDEARTPLILSKSVKDQISNDVRRQALDLVDTLAAGQDYKILKRERRILLTKTGCAVIERSVADQKGAWQQKVIREELIIQALTAKFLFHRNQDYLVKDGNVKIIDEYTGRIMEDRFWSEGLHQLIELKEGCDPSLPRATMARMTYQRFFRRYYRMCGMSGTVREVGNEIWSVYRKQFTKIPANAPLKVKTIPDLVFVTSVQKWRHMALLVQEIHKTGAPVLIGTRSVSASHQASQALEQLNVPHIVLNAEQDSEEANIVARAGECGSVTVATNMAGRGTDIKLGDGACDLGGLHVIMTEKHDSKRVDRQLSGRCGRQGEPGFFQPLLSLEDPLLEMDGNHFFAVFAKLLMPILGMWVGRFVINHAQVRAEAMHARMRQDLLNADQALGDSLAFTGQGE